MCHLVVNIVGVGRGAVC